MKMKLRLITFLLVCFLSVAANSTINSNEHYRADFASGNVYDIRILGNHVFWKGIAGVDKGEVRHNVMKHKVLSPQVDVYQWTENRTGAFVTLVLDKKNHQAICSGKEANNKQWFWSGEIKPIHDRI